jgi:hypothetical protein
MTVATLLPGVLYHLAAASVAVLDVGRGLLPTIDAVCLVPWLIGRNELLLESFQQK